MSDSLQASANVRPRTMFVGDNLPILRGLEPASVDLVYADPPFSKGREFAAPVGSKAAGAMFRDAWTLNDVDVAWSGEIRGLNPAVAAQREGIGPFRVPGPARSGCRPACTMRLSIWIPSGGFTGPNATAGCRRSSAACRMRRGCRLKT